MTPLLAYFQMNWCISEGAPILVSSMHPGDRARLIASCKWISIRLFKSWTLLLAIAAFSLSLLGTFLIVRPIKHALVSQKKTAWGRPFFFWIGGNRFLNGDMTWARLRRLTQQQFLISSAIYNFVEILQLFPIIISYGGNGLLNIQYLALLIRQRKARERSTHDGLRREQFRKMCVKNLTISVFVAFLCRFSPWIVLFQHFEGVVNLGIPPVMGGKEAPLEGEEGMAFNECGRPRSEDDVP